MFTKANVCSLIIILFHIVGLYGFTNPELTDLFISLVPYHLLLMLVLLAISGYDGSSEILVFALIVFLAGFLVEVAGVNTGWIFGSYSYGETLGLKLWRTPLLIGVNWLILVYSTGVLLSRHRLNTNRLSLIGASILVAIDVLIEPVAIRYDYWSWSGGNIPLQNYVGWFIVSYMMFMVFSKFKFRKHNRSAIVLFVAQVLFFIALNKWGT